MQLFDNTLLFLFPSAAKAGDRGQDGVQIGTSGFHLSVLESIGDELPGLIRFQLLLCNQGSDGGFPLFSDEGVPLIQNVIGIYYVFDEGFNQLLLAAQLSMM